MFRNLLIGRKYLNKDPRLISEILIEVYELCLQFIIEPNMPYIEVLLTHYFHIAKNETL